MSSGIGQANVQSMGRFSMATPTMSTSSYQAIEQIARKAQGEVGLTSSLMQARGGFNLESNFAVQGGNQFSSPILTAASPSMIDVGRYASQYYAGAQPTGSAQFSGRFEGLSGGFNVALQGALGNGSISSSQSTMLSGLMENVSGLGASTYAGPVFQDGQLKFGFQGSPLQSSGFGGQLNFG